MFIFYNYFKMIIFIICKSKKVFKNSLLRNGRFDIEFNFCPPDFNDRLEILVEWSKNCKITTDFNFDCISLSTKGFCAGDLMSLCQESCINALKESFRSSRIVPLSISHFKESMKYISPTLLKDTISTNKDAFSTGFDSIGGLNNVKCRLKQVLIV